VETRSAARVSTAEAVRLCEFIWRVTSCSTSSITDLFSSGMLDADPSVVVIRTLYGLVPQRGSHAVKQVYLMFFMPLLHHWLYESDISVRGPNCRGCSAVRSTYEPYQATN